MCGMVLSKGESKQLFTCTGSRDLRALSVLEHIGTGREDQDDRIVCGGHPLGGLHSFCSISKCCFLVEVASSCSVECLKTTCPKNPRDMIFRIQYNTSYQTVSGHQGIGTSRIVFDFRSQWCKWRAVLTASAMVVTVEAPE